MPRSIFNALVTEAHRRGKKVAAHAHGTAGIKAAIRAGVDSVEHASFIDDEGMAMLEAKKDEVFVAPGLNWIRSMLEDKQYGLSEYAENYDAELVVMHRSKKSFWKSLFGARHTKNMASWLKIPLMIMENKE